MKMSAPRVYTWVLGLVLLVLGILGYQDIIEAFNVTTSFYLETGGLALMLISSLVKGL